MCFIIAPELMIALISASLALSVTYLYPRVKRRFASVFTTVRVMRAIDSNMPDAVQLCRVGGLLTFAFGLVWFIRRMWNHISAKTYEFEVEGRTVVFKKSEMTFVQHVTALWQTFTAFMLLVIAGSSLCSSAFKPLVVFMRNASTVHTFARIVRSWCRADVSWMEYLSGWAQTPRPTPKSQIICPRCSTMTKKVRIVDCSCGKRETSDPDHIQPCGHRFLECDCTPVSHTSAGVDSSLLETFVADVPAPPTDSKYLRPWMYKYIYIGAMVVVSTIAYLIWHHYSKQKKTLSSAAAPLVVEELGDSVPAAAAPESSNVKKTSETSEKSPLQEEESLRVDPKGRRPRRRPHEDYEDPDAYEEATSRRVDPGDAASRNRPRPAPRVTKTEEKTKPESKKLKRIVCLSCNDDHHVVNCPRRSPEHPNHDSWADRVVCHVCPKSGAWHQFIGPLASKTNVSLLKKHANCCLVKRAEEARSLNLPPPTGARNSLVAIYFSTDEVPERQFVGMAYRVTTGLATAKHIFTKTDISPEQNVYITFKSCINSVNCKIPFTALFPKGSKSLSEFEFYAESPYVFDTGADTIFIRTSWFAKSGLLTFPALHPASAMTVFNNVVAPLRTPYIATMRDDEFVLLPAGPIAFDGGGALTHTASTQVGDSGSPLLMVYSANTHKGDPSVTVIGTHVGTRKATNPTDTVNVVTPLTDSAVAVLNGSQGN